MINILPICSLFVLFVATIQGQGIGIAFSGAGGRIGQHIALAQALITGNYPGAVPIRPSYLSGASSGSISSVLVNAIIESEETHRINWTWAYAEQLLFNLTTSQVIDLTWEGIARIDVNMLEGYIVDNTPLINFLTTYFHSAGYYTLGDLYIPTAITLVNQSSGLPQRFWSDDPQWQALDLVEVVVASCSIPIAFVPRQVNMLGDTYWIDGGTGIDTLPVFSLLDRSSVESVYVICYASALTSGGGTEPGWVQDIRLLANSLSVIDNMRVELFLAGIQDLGEQMKKPAYSYIPVFNETFSTFDFDEEKLEFTLATQWAIMNNPLRLNP
jgi:predicted acylesterase/phospholipase RssA